VRAKSYLTHKRQFSTLSRVARAEITPSINSPAMKAVVIASIFLLGLATGLALPEGKTSIPPRDFVTEQRRS
jgi:hypothetical protein